jgi:dihydrofolate reductase
VDTVEPKRPELLIDFITSLDGYGAAEGWPGLWGLEGPECLVTEDPVEAVRQLKAHGTGSMRTIGSLTLCRSLLAAGLADRFRVVVFPVITGSSGHDRIYDGYPDVSLEMVRSRTFDGRLQLLEYVPTVLTGPPGTST